MTTRVDVEEIEATKGEKLLAGVLTLFLLTGALWIYFHIDVERDHAFRDPEAALSATDRAALEDREDAALAARRAGRSETRSRRDLEDAREAYRTALEEGGSAPALAARYREAQADYARAQARRRDARRALAAAEPRGLAVERRLDTATRREQARIDRAERRDSRVSFARRMGLVLLSLGGAYVLLGRLRRRRSRWLPTGMAAVAAVALLSGVMAVDYLTDYIEVTETGVLVLSLAGAAITMAAFAALQCYLARRLPERRVRRRECPFCGFPVTEGRHCEGCGRGVVGECSTCHTPRRVGARHCGACGAA
jgi:hypothetical protein